MKKSIYTSYDELPLLLNVKQLVDLMGVSDSSIHQMIGSAYNLAMPRIARRITKGLFSTVENSPFETPRERKGLPPLDPRTAHIKSPSQQLCV